MSLSSFVINKIIPLFATLLGAKKGTWKYEKYTTAILSMLMIPLKRIKGIRRNPKFVENQYDEISGMYIQDNYYKSKMRFSVVSGKVKKISSIDNMQEIRKEIREVLAKCDFKNILEVGVGELTTIEDIFQFFGPEIECYGIDLSLNRIKHGLDEYQKRHSKLPKVAKANALKLPFPDNSFDLVITRHTLEQMPKIYQDALDEIFRVSKKHVILFEPSFEMGSFAQKLKMLNTDYVRGIPKYISSKSNLKFNEPYLMSNSANPLNHTACFKATIENATENNAHMSKDVPFVCPITKTELEHHASYYYSKKAKQAYPIIEGIPVLDPDYSLVLSGIDE
jgi:ubiquinone/menaquinone biosynthesis C-methylase UbiE